MESKLEKLLRELSGKYGVLNKMEGYGVSYGDITCDAGYESQENYTYFEQNRTGSQLHEKLSA